MEKKKILVCGAGSVGVYFSGRLAQAGHAVSVVARNDYEAAKAGGYNIASIAGDFVFKPHEVLKNAAEYKETADYVFLCAKLLPGIDQISLIRGAVRSKETVIVLIQNGIEIEEPVKAAFPDNGLISVIAYIGASRPAPGRMLHQGGGTLKLGSYPSGLSAGAKTLSDMFNAVGVSCAPVEDITYHRWLKLMWNLPYNPVSVLGGCINTKEMTSRDEIEDLTIALMREMTEVARSRGIVFTEEDIQNNLDYTRNFPPYKTSMLQDFEAGRGLEVEPILGNTLRIAQRNGIDTPYIKCCYALLKSVDAQRQKLSKQR